MMNLIVSRCISQVTAGIYVKTVCAIDKEYEYVYKC